MAILQQVFDEVPTDESTLHAMSICYRELDMRKQQKKIITKYKYNRYNYDWFYYTAEKVAIIYENACKTDKSEEHMTAWFMAHVRVNLFYYIL